MMTQSQLLCKFDTVTPKAKLAQRQNKKVK